MSKLDGRFALGDYTLVFNVNTFCDLEETFGAQDVNEVLAKIQGLESNPSLRVIRSIFAVALKQEHPEMTEADAGTLISEVGVQESAEALLQAIAQAFPDNESAEGNVPKKRAGSGKRS